VRPFTRIRTLGLHVGATALALTVTACAAAGTPAPAGTSGPGATPGATSGPVGSGAPASAPAGTTAAGTNAPAGDGCRYATVAEVSTAYGFQATTATATPPADDNYVYCQYASADGRTVILTYVSRSPTALMIYDGYKSSGETVSGVGDEAFWSNDVLYVKKGSIFAGIAPRAGSSGSVDVEVAGVALGKVIAGRM
jgi:hypothetical protein